jgi:hypothetical protein
MPVSELGPLLADASDRLRDVPGFPRRPGRPRKARAVDARSSAPPSGADAAHTSRGDLPATCPRLLSLEAAAAYLAVSPWTVRDLDAAGVLKRVRVPLPNGGELRKVLYDREDLDRAVDQWKA